MVPNASMRFVAKIEKIYNICNELYYTNDIPQIENLADQLLVETECDYTELSHAFALFSKLTAEIVVRKIIAMLGRCIDIIFAISITKWNNVKVRTAFTAVDNMGPDLKQSWKQYQALYCAN